MINFYKSISFSVFIVAIIFVANLLINLFLGVKLTWEVVRQVLMLNFVYGLPLCVANSWLADYQDITIPWDKEPHKRAFWGVFGSILLTMGLIITINFVMWVIIWKNPISALWAHENRTFYLIALLITIIVSVTLHAISFFKEGQKERNISAQLRQQKLASELNALRSQVDPHFLFNSFNVLSGLIEEDKEKAQEFLAGLSNIYRYVLEQKDEDTRTVEEELNFARLYLRLQQMRFENSIQLKTQIGTDILNKKLPSLSLQLLLENAIKHNGFDEEDPLNIEILDIGDALTISNNRRMRSNMAPSNGVGLQNIKDRYRLLTKKEPTIESNNDSFTVKLPLI